MKNQDYQQKFAPTKICKKCKREIPKAAKICGNCFSDQGPLLSTVLMLTAVVLLTLLLMTTNSSLIEAQSKVDEYSRLLESKSEIQSSNVTATAETTSTIVEAKEEITEIEDYLTIGDTFNDNNILVSFLSFEDYVSENQYATPKEGYKFVKAEFEVENLTKSSLYVSSIISFSAYADDYVSTQAFPDFDSQSLDGEIATDKKIKGFIFYEIPIETKIFQINYKSNYWSNKSVPFIINY